MRTDLQMFVDHANGRHKQLLDAERRDCGRCAEESTVPHGKLPPWYDPDSCFACGQGNDLATVTGAVAFCAACIVDVIADWLEARYGTRGS